MAQHPKPVRGKIRRQHPQRPPRRGLRAVRIWVPDVRKPDFRSEAHRQSLAVADSALEADDQSFIDALTE